MTKRKLQHEGSGDRSGISRQRRRICKKDKRSRTRMGAVRDPGIKEELKRLLRQEKKLERLHLAIEEGNLDGVKQLVESFGEEKIFLHHGKSALYLACLRQNYRIIALLFHKGAKFFDNEESGIAYSNEVMYKKNSNYINIDLKLVNVFMSQYCEELETSCIYKLMCQTKSLRQSALNEDGLMKKREDALLEMYKFLFKSETNKILMTVLKTEDVNVSYDFESDNVYGICFYGRSSGSCGYTMFHSKEISIGAKTLLPEDVSSTSSGDLHPRKYVYGVVAEELCHLAMLFIFENEAKPYGRGDARLIQEFQGIVTDVKSLYELRAPMEQVLHNVFQCYPESSWECELIARIPHIIGIYGEELGRKKFEEYFALRRLLKFYDEKVHEVCKEYIEELQLKNSHPKLKKALGKDDYISNEEKQIQPLKDNSKGFKDDLLAEHINVIATNCTKLCTLDLYHELKRKFGKKLEKECLFIEGECFLKKRDEILSALQDEYWQYLILVLDDKDLSTIALYQEYIDYLKGHTKESRNIILISNSNSLDDELNSNAVNYQWSYLSEDYKKLCLHSVELIFKGKRFPCPCNEEIIKDLSGEEIINIINRVPIEVKDGVNLDLQGYNNETYIKRKFQTSTFERGYLNKLLSEIKIILSGLEEGGEKERRNNEDLFGEQLVQWLKGPNDEIKSDKSVFIVNKESMNFDKFKKSFHNKKFIWIQYYENEFYFRNSNSPVDVFSRGLKQNFLDEEKILDYLKRRRMVIISDNAGYGKSTVISSLMDKVRRSPFQSWSWRINLGKFSGDYKDPLSLAHIEESSSDEEVLEHLLRMLGLNGIKRLLFREFMKIGVCFLFFDGFDEIPSEYENNALKLLSTLRKHAALNMMITTRKHQQERLEHTLDSYSHQLVPLKKKDQVKYIVKLWRSKLKNPFGKTNDSVTKENLVNNIRSILKQSEEGNSVLEKGGDLIKALKEIESEEDLETIKKKIDKLKFSKLAEKVIQENSMDKDTIKFMGIPLHLFMIGEICFDSHYKVITGSGIYSIYSHFIEKKICIYVEDKEGMLQNGREKKNVIKSVTERAYRIHKALAKQLMAKGKTSSKMNEKDLMNEYDLELCKALGIVFIKGEDVEFLHLTFGEYFFAESICLELDKETFADVLYNNKFTVVRRFLENSLEEKNFENLSKEVLTDFNFLLKLLTEFVNQDPFSSYHLSKFYLQSVTAVHILTCLFNKFEETINSQKLDEFVQKIESELLPSKNWFGIGGFITAKMTKMLINRNFKHNLIIIFGVVLFYSKWNDVIEILDKFISTSDETNEREKAEKLFEILKLRDGKRRSLFDYAVSNERTEVFVRILEYCKKIVGNEKFINEVIKSEEYRKAMDDMIRKLGLNKVIELMKSLKSFFGNEIEFFFDENHKIRMIGKSIRIRDESGKTFQKGIKLIIECFGNVKQTLLGCDYKGNYLIHYLVRERINEIENHMNIIKQYLDDKSEIKQFLMFKNRESRNVFHLAAEERNVNFGEVLSFCENYLGKEEIKEMLISRDNNEEYVLHSLFQSNSSERIFEILDLIKKYLADKEWFGEFLKSKDKYSRNVFHCAAQNRNEVNLSFLNSYLSEYEIKHLLIERNNYGQTCLHCGAYKGSKNLLILLNYSFEILKDNQIQFEEIILAKENGYKYTFLHKFVQSNYFRSNVLIVIKVIKSLKEKVSDEVFKELLRSRDKRGETFLQLGMKKNKEIIKEIEKVFEKDFIKELSEKTGK